MKNHILIFLLLAIFSFNCSSNDDPAEEEIIEDPVAFTVVSINGFVSTGSSTFQVTDLLGNNNTSNVQTTSPLIVTFSKPVGGFDSLINLVRLDNSGSAVAGVSINITKQSDTELLIEPATPLDTGTKYTLNVNAGVSSTDQTSLEDLVSITFTTEGTAAAPLTINEVLATVFNGSGFESKDLIANSPVTEVSKDSEFTVVFSSDLAPEFKTDDQYLDLNRMENGSAVEDIPITLSSVVNNELIITPNSDLVYGTTYQLYFNPGYKAVDGGITSEVIKVEFTIRTPDPLTVSSITANGTNTGGNFTTDLLANPNSTGIPLNSTFTAKFSQTVFSSSNSASFIQLLKVGTTEVISASISEDLVNSRVTLTPSASLETNTQYELKIAQDTVDSVGGTLENDVIVTFTTEN